MEATKVKFIARMLVTRDWFGEGEEWGDVCQRYKVAVM